MTRLRSPTLAQRLPLSPRMAMSVSLLLLLVSAALGVWADAGARAQAIRQGEVQAEILASSLAAPLAFDDVAAVHVYLGALQANPAVMAAGAYGLDGGLVSGFHRGDERPPAFVRAGRPRLARGELIVTAPVVQGSTRLGAVYIRFATEPVLRRLARYTGVGAIIVLASLLVGVLGAAHASLREAHRELQEEIAERERTEEALRQAQKMEAMGQLTGGVAHDFNNLLMVASSGLELIDRTKDPVRRERLKQGIREAIDRGANLTQQLLTFARKTPMKTAVVDLRRVLDGMHEVLDRSLREDVGVTILCEDEVWPVEVDPSQFEVAVLNIAINARDAMPQGGTITIRLANDGERVRVAISDTGVGIPSDALPRIFEPFFTTKPVGRGTGLGLSQVYGFIRSSGGEVQVESVVGQGTTMSLLLPRAHGVAEAATAPETPRVGRSARERTILVVEDDDHVADLVGEMLRELGYAHRHAPDAMDALETLRGPGPVDLVLTDMVMPGALGGLELARRLAVERPELPVVLTTGYSASAMEAAAEGLRLLVKPYRIEALAAELDAALKSRSAARR